MKIAVIDTTNDEELIGGGHLFLPPLLSGLIGRGHEVHLITKGTPNERIRPQINASGVALHHNLWNKPTIAEDAASVLAKWSNELAPDVFLISNSADIGWVVLPLLDRDIATFTIAHSNSTGYYDPLRHYSRFITRGIGVSEELCEQFHKYCGLDREKVKWIPYGVTPLDDMPGHDLADIDYGLRIVYVGRLAEPDKKVSDIIRIVKRLRESSIKYNLKIIGDGPMMPRFIGELDAEIKTGKVEMFGWIENEALLGHLRKSDISLLVSESEGFCIALVEAMANGCAPIVTDIKSGNKQLVEDGVNGFVVPVGDIDAFAGKIKILAADRTKLLEFRRRAWETGRQYSVERMVESYERSFEDAVKDARANPRKSDKGFPIMESCRSKYPLWLRRIVAEFRS